jgi:hypothetical protein
MLSTKYIGMDVHRESNHDLKNLFKGAAIVSEQKLRL